MLHVYVLGEDQLRDRGNARKRQTCDGGRFVDMEERRHAFPLLKTFLEFEHLVLENADFF